MKFLLPAALVLPLALSACDDGADEIAALNTQLEAERARIVELEPQAARVTELEQQVTRLPELETQAARVAELEPQVARVTELEEQVARLPEIEAERDRFRTELETTQARLTELEAGAGTGSAFDVKTIEEPVSVAFVKLRDTDRELRELRRRFADDPDTLQALGSLRTRLGEAGRELGRVAEAAKIDLATTVGD